MMNLNDLKYKNIGVLQGFWCYIQIFVEIINCAFKFNYKLDYLHYEKTIVK